MVRLIWFSTCTTILCAHVYARIPPTRSKSGGGTSTRCVMNQICVGTVRFSTHACATSKCCAFGIQTYMHASRMSIHMFGAHTCSGCLWTLSLAWLSSTAYIFMGPRGRLHHFDQQRERGYQGGFFFSWFALPYNRASIW